jgi:hypothetical protein
MTVDKITELCPERFNVCPNISLEFFNIVIFKNFIKQNNDCLSAVVSIKQNMDVNLQPPYIFVSFVCHKNYVDKIYSPFEDLSAYKISWSHIDCCKFCIHLRCLNVRHSEMVEATGLEHI